MPDSKEQLVEAFAEQGKAQWKYAGTDAWESTKLLKDTKIAQIEFRDINHPDNGKPYSRYFTDASEVEKSTSLDGKVDMAALSERLQVTGHNGQYNGSVSIYEVTEDIDVTTAKVSDNPAFGKGGANQYFLPEGVKNGDLLDKVEHLNGTNRAPRLSIFDDLNGLNPKIKADADKITDIIDSYNDSYIDALVENENPKAIEVADAMQERQDFSETAREIKGDPEAIRAAEIPDAKATLLDLNEATLRQVEIERDKIVRDDIDRVTPDHASNNVDRPASNVDIRRSSTLDADYFTNEDLHANSRPGTESLDEINRKLVQANDEGTLRGVVASPDGSTSYLLDSADNRIYTVTDGGVSHVAQFPDDLRP